MGLGFQTPRSKIFAFYRLRIGRVTSNNKELVDHPLVLLVEAVAGEGHQASSRKGQSQVEAVDGVVAEV